MNGRAQEVLAAMPYSRFLGMELLEDQAGAYARLAYREALIGNPRLPALHGGAIGAFMELTAQASLRLENEGARPITVGVTVEYLRPGRAKDSFARARVLRAGRRVAFVHVEAWQDQESSPFALLQGRFLLTGG